MTMTPVEGRCSPVRGHTHAEGCDEGDRAHPAVTQDEVQGHCKLLLQRPWRCNVHQHKVTQRVKHKKLGGGGGGAEPGHLSPTALPHHSSSSLLASAS